MGPQSSHPSCSELHEDHLALLLQHSELQLKTTNKKHVNNTKILVFMQGKTNGALPSGLRGSKETQRVNKNGRNKKRTRRERLGIRERDIMIIGKTCRASHFNFIHKDCVCMLHTHLSLKALYKATIFYCVKHPLFWVFLDHFFFYFSSSLSFESGQNKLRKKGDKKKKSALYVCVHLATPTVVKRAPATGLQLCFTDPFSFFLLLKLVFFFLPFMLIFHITSFVWISILE